MSDFRTERMHQPLSNVMEMTYLSNLEHDDEFYFICSIRYSLISVRSAPSKSTSTVLRCVAPNFEPTASSTVMGAARYKQLRYSILLTTCSDAPLFMMISNSLFLNSTAANLRSSFLWSKTTPILCPGLPLTFPLYSLQPYLLDSLDLADMFYRRWQSGTAVR